MFSDLRQAFRSLTASKGFSALVIFVLDLGIGASTAIFGIVNGVLLKPLPFSDPERLVTIVDLLRGEEDPDLSFPDFADIRAQARTLDRLAAHTSTGVTMTGQGEAV